MKPPAALQPIAADLKTCAAMCGYSVKTLRRAIEAGELPAVRATSKIVILISDLHRYLEGHKEQSLGPIKGSSKVVKKNFAAPNVVRSGQRRTTKTQ
ncbi:MAG: helix-turn-helix domain-containing protein [Chthoniobacteraceae bacterium]